MQDGDEDSEPLFVSAPSFLFLSASLCFEVFFCHFVSLHISVFLSLSLQTFFSLPSSVLSSNPRVVRQPEPDAGVSSPVGSLRLDQGRSALRHIFDRKNPTFASRVFSQQRQQPSKSPFLLLPARARLTTRQDQGTFLPVSFLQRDKSRKKTQKTEKETTQNARRPPLDL